MLYPKENRARAIMDLGGVWKFKLDNGKGFEEHWEKGLPGETDLIAVPASYNDQKESRDYRYHFGWAFYEREITIPEFYKNQRLFLRFDAVTHFAKVFLNGKLITEHKGGFLPFEIELTELYEVGTTTKLVVAVDNRVNYSTLPVGVEGGVAFFGSDNAGIPSVEAAKRWAKPQNMPNFDFFNFAGINRPVRIYTTPMAYIEDVTFITDIQETDGIVEYSIKTSTPSDCVSIQIKDADGNVVAKAEKANGKLTIPNARLWWPWPGEPYLYTAEIKYGEDIYSQNLGIRTIEVKDQSFFINSKPFYFKGFGKHEDAPFSGRGINLCLDVKDTGLIHWLNANSFRTSHYPYAEEMYDLCDKEGIVIIDETPAVGIGAGEKQDPYKTFSIREHHEHVIEDLINRDKNHPCVVMWSLGNEPDLEHFPESAYDYWHSLYELAHKLDPQNRPVTVVCCQNDYTKDITTRTMDVVCINRYYGWYNLSGDLDAACYALNQELDFWQEQNKPVMFAEYGADSVPGVHATVPEMFTEEYQMEYYEKINAEIDKRTFFIGEHVWNFADFDTIQGCMRVQGNKKGILTRERRPKLAAHYLKKRWEQIPNFEYK